MLPLILLERNYYDPVMAIESALHVLKTIVLVYSFVKEQSYADCDSYS